MSNLIPRRAIDAHRANVNVTLRVYGIDCNLYIPTTASSNSAELLDEYREPSDLVFTPYTAKVFIEWTPNIPRLRKLGLFAEGATPIVGKFGTEAVAQEGSDAGSTVEVDIVVGSYFRVGTEFVPGTVDTTEFEVVNPIPPEVHDAVLWKEFIIAPRRIQQ